MLICSLGKFLRNVHESTLLLFLVVLCTLHSTPDMTRHSEQNRSVVNRNEMDSKSYLNSEKRKIKKEN